MNHFELDTFLRKYDPIEKIQVKTHQNIRDFDGQELTELDDDGIPRLPESYFFKNGPVDVFKHHRFADMPVHKHSFIEINYIYSGVCSQKIDGKTVNLQEGQICLLDSDVPHSIPALGENDILVNIIMKRAIFSQLLVSRLQTSGIVSDFLANAVSENRAHDHYILFYSEDFPNLHAIVKNMFCEVFDGDEYSDQLLLNYIPILFTELMRVYRVDKNFEIGNVSRRANLIHILNISRNIITTVH
jgi:mannose-6-phosphate isomerase-like protein (cupin superfamily)